MNEFRNWDKTATVRTRTRRSIEKDLLAGKALFPAKLVPYLAHPIIDNHLESRDPIESGTLLAHHLYQYLFFTIHFETKVVNRVTHFLAHEHLPCELSAKSRIAALQIYTDEGYHALCSLDLVQQIEDATKITARPYDFSTYLSSIERAREFALQDEPILGMILQVVIFETVVTSLLADIPRDPQVASVVRETVADHAHDESFHHAYFARIFEQIWINISPDQRRSIAFALPKMITASLLPHLGPLVEILDYIGIPREEIDTVLRDVYNPDFVLNNTRSNARHTLKLFANTGVLDIPGVDEAFWEAKLMH